MFCEQAPHSQKYSTSFLALSGAAPSRRQGINQVDLSTAEIKEGSGAGGFAHFVVMATTSSGSAHPAGRLSPCVETVLLADADHDVQKPLYWSFLDRFWG